MLHNICVLRGDELDVGDGDDDDSDDGDDDDDDESFPPPPTSEATAVVLQALVHNIANQ